MPDVQQQIPSFDIGVEAKPGDNAAHRAPTVGAETDRRRSLPTWAIAALALLVGLVGGSILNSSNDREATTVPSEAAAGVGSQPSGTDGEAEPAAPTPPPFWPPRSASASQAVSLRDGQTLVVADLSGASREPTPITLLTNRDSRTMTVTERLAGPTTEAIGRLDSRVVQLGNTVIFVGARSAFALRTDSSASPSPIVPAVSLLPGSSPSEVWALSPQRRIVHLIDADSLSVRATYDLGSVGEPIASHNGGLVVAPDIERFGAFALWSPARGIERLWSFDDDADFIDATSNVVVVGTSQGLASFNTVTGALTQTDRPWSSTGQAGAFLSPDGSHLAVVPTEDDDGIAVVTVLELLTGATIDEFAVAAPWLLDWTSDDQIMHLDPSGEQLQLRHVSAGFDTTVTIVEGPITWAVLSD